MKTSKLANIAASLLAGLTLSIATANLAQAQLTRGPIGKAPSTPSTNPGNPGGSNGGENLLQGCLRGVSYRMCPTRFYNVSEAKTACTQNVWEDGKFGFIFERRYMCSHRQLTVVSQL